MANETIGLAPCLNCGAQVPYRLDKQGRAYFRCTGTHDPERKACGMAVLYFGHADTEKLIAKFKGDNNAAVQNRDDDKREPERADPPAAEKRQPKSRRERAEGGIFDDLIGD